VSSLDFLKKARNLCPTNDKSFGCTNEHPFERVVYCKNEVTREELKWKNLSPTVNCVEISNDIVCLSQSNQKRKFAENEQNERDRIGHLQKVLYCNCSQLMRLVFMAGPLHYHP
jgi:hypothetical protein